MSADARPCRPAASDVQAELEREMAADEGMPTVKHYTQREYAGMFEYRKDDEPLLVRNLIIGALCVAGREHAHASLLPLKLLFCVSNVPNKAAWHALLRKYVEKSWS